MSLITAAKTGNLNNVTKLIYEGADVNIKDEYGVTPLMIASMCKYEDKVNELLKAGADVNSKDKYGGTP